MTIDPITPTEVVYRWPYSFAVSMIVGLFAGDQTVEDTANRVLRWKTRDRRRTPRPSVRRRPNEP